ncbi:hypothetical protein BFL35_02130 [Clavibacter michiganensis]|nr:hypothetical protein BFL35_02130 [Clavibacter michiganensis]
MKPRPSLAVVSIALVAIMGLGGCTASDPERAEAATTSRPADPATSGVQGAAHFDEGFVQIGTGEKVVDVYLDAMCPHCREFEQASMAGLLADAAAGRTEVRIHPIAILDRLSLDSRYSTRAAADIVDVAVHHPESVAPVVRALFEHQPAEGSSGPTDVELVALISDTTKADLSGSPMQAAYRSWVTARTAAATTGPLPETQDIARLLGVPTVIVDGDLYTGPGADGASFSRFYDAR